MPGTNRDEFMQRIRDAVREGNRAGHLPPLPERGQVGYQGDGPDPIARLRTELLAAGGVLHEAKSIAEARQLLQQIVHERNARKLLVGDGSILDEIDVQTLFLELTVVHVESLEADREREEFFTADVGISGVDAVLAETGSIVLFTRRDQPRSLSLLPPVHVALARREQLVADLFDLFQGADPPSCLSIITGPSKTGDIELRLVTGVHGPGEVHLILINESA